MEKRKEFRVEVSPEFHRTVKAQAASEGLKIRELILMLLKDWLKEKGIEIE